MAQGFAAGGETNTGENIGTGSEVFKQKVSSKLQMRKLNAANADLTVTQNTNDITVGVNADTAATANTIAKRGASGRVKSAAGGTGTDALVADDAATAATANKIAKRDASGRIAASDPSAATDVVNKQFFDASLGVTVAGPFSTFMGSFDVGGTTTHHTSKGNGVAGTICVIYRSNTSVRFVKSTDGGVTWGSSTEVVASVPSNDDMDLVAFDANNISVLYRDSLSDYVVVRSTNGGTTFGAPVNLFTGTAGSGAAVRLSSTTGLIIMDGASAGMYVSRTTNAGANWTTNQISTDTLSDPYHVAVNPNDSNKVIIAANDNYVYTSNGGTSWTFVSAISEPTANVSMVTWVGNKGTISYSHGTNPTKMALTTNNWATTQHIPVVADGYSSAKDSQRELPLIGGIHYNCVTQNVTDAADTLIVAAAGGTPCTVSMMPLKLASGPIVMTDGVSLYFTGDGTQTGNGTGNSYVYVWKLGTQKAALP